VSFDVWPVEAGETMEARQFAAGLIGRGIVSALDLERVHRQSGGLALFVAREEGALSGVLAFVLLNAAGLRAVQAESFDALAPAPWHLARPGERAEGFYGWGVAATTKPSARRVVGAAHAVMHGPLSHLPKYARPTTEAGRRLMCERLGFGDLPGSRTGLVWQAPLEAAVAA
jgi:hypothetical protein